MTQTYTVAIKYTRPDYPEYIKFLQFHKAKGPPEDIKKIFTRAFKEANPDCMIQEIRVDLI